MSDSSLVSNLVDIYESFRLCETRKLEIGPNARVLTVNHEFHQASDGLLTATYDTAFNSSSNSDSSSSSDDDEEEIMTHMPLKKQASGSSHACGQLANG